MAESHASQLLQDFKAEVFDRDLLEILDQDPTAYKDILTMIKGVQKLRVGTEISSFLISFEYMLNVAATQFKNKKTYQEVLQDQRGKSERTFSSIQEVRNEISDTEKQLNASNQRKTFLDQEIEVLEKKLEEMKQERASLNESHGKLAEDIQQKTQVTLQSAKTLIDLREAIVDSENRFDTTCQRLRSIRANYEDLKARCPF
jgi:chromosome segregation ATPase